MERETEKPELDALRKVHGGRHSRRCPQLQIHTVLRSEIFNNLSHTIMISNERAAVHSTYFCSDTFGNLRRASQLVNRVENFKATGNKSTHFRI